MVSLLFFPFSFNAHELLLLFPFHFNAHEYLLLFPFLFNAHGFFAQALILVPLLSTCKSRTSIRGTLAEVTHSGL